MESRDTAWAETSAPVQTDDGEVHVWRFPVDLTQADLDRCRSLLSDEERLRADRFARPRDRDRFTVARAGLRRLLAYNLETGPGAVTFVTGPHGKPRLADPVPAGGLEFNVSHAGALVLVALARRGAVGVDLEPADRDLDPDDVAQRVLSPAEIAALDGLQGAARLRRFLEIWTVKEAVVKALGRGISFPLSSFSVDFAAPATVRLSGAGVAGDLADIAVSSLVPGPGYVGAAAVLGSGFRLRTFSAGPDLPAGPTGGNLEQKPG